VHTVNDEERDGCAHCLAQCVLCTLASAAGDSDRGRWADPMLAPEDAMADTVHGRTLRMMIMMAEGGRDHDERRCR